jgi:hypothetical protein
MRRITYTNTEDDFLALQKLYLNRFKTLGRQLKAFRWAAALFVVVVLFAVSWMTGRVAYAAGGLFGAVALFAILPKAIGRSLDKFGRKMLAEGGGEGFLGEHEMLIDGGDLIERSPGNETRTPIQTLRDVVIDGDRVFLIFGPGAHVIPRGRTSGDLGAFLDELERQRRSRAAASDQT